MDAKNVHSNWTKEEADEGDAVKKRDTAAGVEEKPGKTQITISEGTLAKNKGRQEKKVACRKNAVTSNSGCPVPSYPSRQLLKPLGSLSRLGNFFVLRYIQDDNEVICEDYRFPRVTFFLPLYDRRSNVSAICPICLGFILNLAWTRMNVRVYTS